MKWKLMEIHNKQNMSSYIKNRLFDLINGNELQPRNCPVMAKARKYFLIIFEYHYYRFILNIPIFVNIFLT